jgi:hypothetical protein
MADYDIAKYLRVADASSRRFNNSSEGGTCDRRINKPLNGRWSGTGLSCINEAVCTIPTSCGHPARRGRRKSKLTNSNGAKKE